MFPEFPASGPIPLDAGAAVAALAQDMGRNSDFTHLSLWVWALERRIRVSALNGNLIVQYQNARTGQQGYTFAGCNKVEATAETLLSAAAEHGWPRELFALPEATAKSINNPCFRVAAERDYSDYLYNTAELSDFSSERFRSHRKLVKQFWKNPSASVEQLDLARETTAREIVALATRWRENKECDGKPIVQSAWGDDLGPTARLLSCAPHFNMLGIGVRINGELAAYLIAELCDGHAIAHFGKADTRLAKGAHVVAIHELARALLARGYPVLNYQEDLGDPSLRATKLRLRPFGFAEKYTVRLATEKDRAVPRRVQEVRA